VRTATPVRAIHREPGRAFVRDDADVVERFDAVVVATHPDQALRLLADATAEERAVLGAFPYSSNVTVLHTDPSVLPRSRSARASWNYRLPSCTPPRGSAEVSYDLNRLQGLDSPTPFIVTLNDTSRIRPGAVLASMRYEHPVYTPASVAAQNRLPSLNTPVTAFAGAYHGWGFHEDGCRSGVAAAAALGVAW
jgi:predicted NAD/FAD-binding protein